MSTNGTANKGQKTEEQITEQHKVQNSENYQRAYNKSTKWQKLQNSETIGIENMYIY